MVKFTQEWLQLEEQLGGRSAIKGTAEEMQAQFDGLIAMLLPQLPPPSPNVEAKDGEVDGIKYRIYTPKEAAAKGALPVGMYFHGGGWVLGNLDAEDPICRAIAEHTPSIVVSVDYRLAPQYKWPTQLQDCLTVVKWARQNASSFGGDPNKFFTAGSSAGASLALGVVNRIVQNSALKDTIKGVVAMVPATLHYDNVPAEYKSLYKSYEENATDVPVIDRQSMVDFINHTEIPPDDKDAWVALSTENHKNYPPTYIVTCEGDPLRDDGVILEEALKKAGVPVKSNQYKGLPHCFWIFPSIPEAQQFAGNLVAGVQWVVGQM